MANIVLGFILGIVGSLPANLIWHEAGHDIAWRTRRAVHRVVGRRHRHAPPAGFLQVGQNTIPWVVAAYGPYRPETVEIHWDPRPWKLHPVVQTLYDQRRREYERASARGEPAPFNGMGYKLESFWVGGRRGADEEPVLSLRFRPTDYFSMLVTDQALDEPVQVDGQTTTLRELFAAHVDLAVRPVPEFATHFGIALQVVTADGQTVFSERGRTAVDAFVFFPSVAEGSARPVDAGPKGGPDPYRTAVRGAAEELGIDVPAEAIRFLSFGANAVLCEYGLIGVAYVRETADQLRRLRATGIPKDKWENQRLHFVPWTPEAVAEFIGSHGPWSPFAIVAAFHGLYDRFGLARVERAFSGVRIRLSQNLPRR